MGMNMKREWILWNALGSPENIVKDERMEEIERKGYYWAYRILDGAICASVVVLIWGSALGLEGFGETVPTGLLCHLLLSLLLFTELGRFLYSCYHGTQELLGRRGGMPAFLGAVIGAGIWAVWGVRGYWGFVTPAYGQLSFLEPCFSVCSVIWNIFTMLGQPERKMRQG